MLYKHQKRANKQVIIIIDSFHLNTPSLLIAMNQPTIGPRWSVFIVAGHHVENLSHRRINSLKPPTLVDVRVYTRFDFRIYDLQETLRF